MRETLTQAEAEVCMLVVNASIKKEALTLSAEQTQALVHLLSEGFQNGHSEAR